MICLPFFSFQNRWFSICIFIQFLKKKKKQSLSFETKTECFDLIYSSGYAFLLQTIKVERKAFYPPLEGYRNIIARPKNLMLYPSD